METDHTDQRERQRDALRGLLLGACGVRPFIFVSATERFRPNADVELSGKLSVSDVSKTRTAQHRIPAGKWPWCDPSLPINLWIKVRRI